MAISGSHEQNLPGPGEIVRIRQRRYLIEEVAEPSTAGDSILVRLSCVEDDAQGQELEVLWDLESDAQVISWRNRLRSSMTA